MEPPKDAFVWPKTVTDEPLKEVPPYTAPLPPSENPYAATSLDIEPESEQGKSYAVTWLLAWLLPGIELIYLGYIVRGIIKFITLGGVGIWTIASLVHLFAGKTVSKDNRVLLGRSKYLALSLTLTILIAVAQVTAGVAFARANLSFSALESIATQVDEPETSANTINATVANTPKDAAIAEKATTVQKIAEYFASTTPDAAQTYPTTIRQFATTDIPLPTNTVISGSDPTAANGDTTIGYKYIKGKHGADGGKISYWDYSRDSLAQPLYVGAISGNSTYTAPAN